MIRTLPFRILAVVAVCLALTSCGTRLAGIPSLGTSLNGRNALDLNHLREDYTRLGAVAKVGHDPIGQQCSADGLAATEAALTIANTETTGYALTDIEVARLTRPSSLVLLWQRAAESCAPLLVGRDSLVATALTLPKWFIGLLRGQK